MENVKWALNSGPWWKMNGIGEMKWNDFPSILVRSLSLLYFHWYLPLYSNGNSSPMPITHTHKYLHFTILVQCYSGFIWTKKRTVLFCRFLPWSEEWKNRFTWRPGWPVIQWFGPDIISYFNSSKSKSIHYWSLNNDYGFIPFCTLFPLMISSFSLHGTLTHTCTLAHIRISFHSSLFWSLTMFIQQNWAHCNHLLSFREYLIRFKFKQFQSFF